MEPRVYVVQEQPRLNYSDAQRFGDITFVCQYDYSPGDRSRFNQLIREGIVEALSTFDNENDFLLLVGDPVLIGLVMSHALETGPVNVLKWDKPGRRYTEVRGIKKAPLG